MFFQTHLRLVIAPDHDCPGDGLTQQPELLEGGVGSERVHLLLLHLVLSVPLVLQLVNVDGPSLGGRGEAPLDVTKGVNHPRLLLLFLLLVLLDHKSHARRLLHDVIPHGAPELELRPHLLVFPLQEPLSQQHQPGGEQVQWRGCHVSPLHVPDQLGQTKLPLWERRC